ncbi:MAG: hypothetical protein M3198_19305 [Actinomycetota bacterium]|nr:hypothetical protein [Actinomycetota bacterium]
MRRLVAVGVALFVVTAPTALAADVDTATIEGRILSGQDERPVPDAKVTLLGARLDGAGRVVRKTTVPDDRGRYSFEVPDRKGVEYALEASYDGGLFVGDSFSVKGDEMSFDLEVWETTSDPSVITVLRDHMFVAHDEEGAGVLESVTINNSSDRAYIGRGRALGGGDSASSPTLGFALPTQSLGERVDLVDSSLNRLYAVDADFGFAATVAIPPGETTVTYAYPARGSGGSYDLTRRALYPTEELSVFATDPLEVESGRLTYEGREEVGGESYRRWVGNGGFDAGDVVSLLVVAEGNSSSTLWLTIGIGFALIVLLIAVGLWLRSRSGKTTSSRPRGLAPAAEAERGDDLIAAIAALDLQHDAGSISDEQWSSRRSELKTKLLDSRQTT